MSSGIVERAKRERHENHPTRKRRLSPRCVSPFLAWGDFHARWRFARSTIPKDKWGTTRSLVSTSIPLVMLEQFCNQLNDKIKTINPNRHEIYIFGDMNINFLKFNEHTQTEEFLDMLYANNILPIITKPTRLTDHTATLMN